MKLVQIYIPTEIIHYTLQKFGEYSILHVIDVKFFFINIYTLYNI